MKPKRPPVKWLEPMRGAAIVSYTHIVGYVITVRVAVAAQFNGQWFNANID